MKVFVFYLERYRTTDNLQLIVSEMPFENEKFRLTDIQLRNVTRLHFNPYFARTSSKFSHSFVIFNENTRKNFPYYINQENFKNN